MRLEISVPIPSFRMSRIFNTAETICPINPAFSILSEKLSPILLTTSADSLPASEISFPVSFSPSAASLASLIALRPSMPPFNSSKEFHSSDSWDNPEVERNVPISLIGLITSLAVCWSFLPLVLTLSVAIWYACPLPAISPAYLSTSPCALSMLACMPLAFALSRLDCASCSFPEYELSAAWYSYSACCAACRAFWYSMMSAARSLNPTSDVPIWLRMFDIASTIVFCWSAPSPLNLSVDTNFFKSSSNGWSWDFITRPTLSKTEYQSTLALIAFASTSATLDSCSFFNESTCHCLDSLESDEACTSAIFLAYSLAIASFCSWNVPYIWR